MLDTTAFYKAAELTGNPFRQNSSLENDPRRNIWIGYATERDILESYLEDTRSDQTGASSLLLLYGDLGAGKTHACLWAQYRILKERASEFNSVVYYISKLRVGDKISFAAAFEHDIIRKGNTACDVIGLRQHLDELVVSYRAVHGAHLKKDEVLQAIIPSYELCTLAEKVINCQSDLDVDKLLHGSKASEYDTVALFTGLIRLFTLPIEINGNVTQWKKASYLFVDELNILTDVSPKEGRFVNELIRNIYDECSYAFCMVLAFTASVTGAEALFDDWVFDRVSKQIVMQTLPQNEAISFVEGILRSARLDGSTKASYFPFDYDAIQDIVSEMNSITPRRIMKAMERVIEECRRKGADPSNGVINSQFIQDHDILSQVSSTPL